MNKFAKFEELLRDKGYFDKKEEYVKDLFLTCKAADFLKKVEMLKTSLNIIKLF